MPNAAAPITKVSVAPFRGELPARGGKERQPNPYDDVVAKAAETGDPMLAKVEYTDPADLKPHTNALRSAAEHIGKGLDIWIMPEGVVFKVRDKIKRPARPAA